MTHDNCNLFKRSYTDKGMGFTFNNEPENIMIKREFRSSVLFPNTNKKPSFMTSAATEHALTVVIENNEEEVSRYVKDKDNIKSKPTEITVSLHNPKEPADMRSRSFSIPLGHSTKVYITPKARAIDEDGMSLMESQRECRLDNDIENLKIFNVYTRAACMLECKIEHAKNWCGCVPWNYPHQVCIKISLKCFSSGFSFPIPHLLLTTSFGEIT